MFENYIEEYFQTAFAEFEEMEKVELKHVFNSDNLPTPIKYYIENEAKQSLHFTSEYIENSPIFNSKDSEVEKSISILESALKNSMNIDNISFENFLKNSIEIRFNFILRPKFTLTNLIFKDSDEVETDLIKSTFNYFNDYKYLKNGFFNHLESEPSILIEKEEFENIIKKIDDEYIYNLSSSEFVDLLLPCFKLFTYDGLKEQKLVPVEAIMIFLDEKGIYPLLEKMQELINDENKEFLSFEEFSQFVGSLDSNEEPSADEDIISESADNFDDLDEELDSFSEDIDKDIDIENDTEYEDNEKLKSDFDYDSEIDDFDLDLEGNNTEEDTKDDQIREEPNESEADLSEDKSNEPNDELSESISELEEMMPGEDEEIKEVEDQEDKDEFQSEIENIYSDLK